MKQEELLKGLTYLGTAYGKEYSKMECELHYDFLKDYSYKTFVTAIKNLIKKSKFLPKITELLEECENCKEKTNFGILEFMKTQGYFKNGTEYDKAIRFLERNIIPNWFAEDMKKYYEMMKQGALEYKETLMIGEEYGGCQRNKL